MVLAVVAMVTAAIGSVDNKNITFFSPSIGKTRVRDSYKAFIASYGSQEFFKNICGGRSYHTEAYWTV